MRKLALAVFCFMVAGCNQGPSVAKFVSAGESAPELGAAETKDINSFVVGRWAENDFETPTEVKNYYEFAADGTFVAAQAPYKMAGKWTLSGEQINLTYDTLDGKPLQQEMDAIRKRAETGGQAALLEDLVSDWIVNATAKKTTLHVAEDKKSLDWGPKPTAPAPGTPMEEGFSMDAMSISPPLSRLKEVK